MAQQNGESTGELLKQFSQDASTLIRKELELAKAELTEKGKQAGKGAGMFGGAGLFGLGAFGALTAFLILVLAEAIEETRGRMSDTVDQLAHKANVPGRVKEAVADKRDRLMGQMRGTASSVGEATPDASA